jgi:aspartate dehydrogenase
MLRVALIGFGQIGQQVAEALQSSRDAHITAVLVRHLSEPHRGTPFLNEALLTDQPDAFFSVGSDIVVEVAGHEAVRTYGERVLSTARDLMLLSIGALAEESLFIRLREQAQVSRKRILLPSGAIAGLDAIAAAARGGLDEVSHTVRKPPGAFTAEQIAGRPTDSPLVLYEGSAQDGVKRFPENVNVAAAVSIAGVGFARTRLRVVADPAVQFNTHEVEARGYFGRLHLRMENVPTANPKTGRIVALSVIKAIGSLTAPVVIGL